MNRGGGVMSTDHKAKALELIEVAQNAHQAESATAAATAAQVHATLALVEQQRLNTAALLLLSEDMTLAPHEWKVDGPWGAVALQIREGLGLS